MASKRKPIPKSTRFEVFKRDKFTCQYCGASAPEVILEVDHIKPVSKGGTDDLMNLITACRDCNRGKTNRELSDNATVMKQKRELDAMQEKREQMGMVMKWREELENEAWSEAEYIDAYVFFAAGYKLTNQGLFSLKKLIHRFGFNEVYDASEIALEKYCKGTEQSFEYAFSKIGGICYNRRKAREANAK